VGKRCTNAYDVLKLFPKFLTKFVIDNFSRQNRAECQWLKALWGCVWCHVDYTLQNAVVMIYNILRNLGLVLCLKYIKTIIASVTFYFQFTENTWCLSKTLPYRVASNPINVVFCQYLLSFCEINFFVLLLIH
jgi:hypothetical protein